MSTSSEVQIQTLLHQDLFYITLRFSPLFEDLCSCLLENMLLNLTHEIKTVCCIVQIHWFSIFNSFMMVIFLTGLVSMILMRTLRNDYAKYAREDDDLESLVMLLICYVLTIFINCSNFRLPIIDISCFSGKRCK